MTFMTRGNVIGRRGLILLFWSKDLRLLLVFGHEHDIVFVLHKVAQI